MPNFKPLIIATILATTASSAFALNLFAPQTFKSPNAYTGTNVDKVCIQNDTDNNGSNQSTHWVQLQLSHTGNPAPANHYGVKAQYARLSCVSTSVLNNDETTQIFSVGESANDALLYFTPCGNGYHANVNHNSQTVMKGINAYYRAYQVGNETKCEFLYDSTYYHGTL